MTAEGIIEACQFMFWVIVAMLMLALIFVLGLIICICVGAFINGIMEI